MYMCTYTCMCVCVCVCMCMYMCMHMHMHMYMYIYVCVYVNVEDRGSIVVRCCATNRKVAGSIPASVTGFH